jgi:hypothetical protein
MLQSDRDTVTHGAIILVFTDSSHSWICLSAPADHLYECRSSYVPRFISFLKIEIARDIRSSRDRKKERLLLDKGVRVQIVKRRLAPSYRVVTILIDERGTILCGLRSAAAR